MQSDDEDVVVVSGMSVRLPESDDVDEFWNNLVNGVDMVTEDDRRWPPGTYRRLNLITQTVLVMAL